jgi:Rrf2 family protein
MKIGTRARYSMRLLLALSRLETNGDPVRLEDVADHCGLSLRYLGQLIGPLKNAGLVHARAGRRGGYLLARPPGEIPLRDVVEAAIGPISIVDCVGHPTDCMQSEYCNCLGLWSLINRQIRKSLEQFTVADLLAEDWPRRIEREMAALEQGAGD